MRFPESKVIEALREKYPAGCRVKLTKMDDVQAPPIGTLGTVDCVDDIGSIHVKWDTGSRLAVAYGADEYLKNLADFSCWCIYTAPAFFAKIQRIVKNPAYWR